MRIKNSGNKHIKLIVILLSLTAFLYLAGESIKLKKAERLAKTSVQKKTSLNQIQIILKRKDYDRLKNYRDSAVALQVLPAKYKKYVPAKILYQGKKYKARIRLKGDWTDHLKGKKWSFRIKLKGDGRIEGMKEFSLQHPGTRGYLNEWFFHRAVKSEDITGLRYDFVESTLQIREKNGQYTNLPLGIYALEETFDKWLIENNRRKESIILKYDEEYFWNHMRKAHKIKRLYGYDHWFFFEQSYFPVSMFKSKKYLQDNTMRGYFKLSKYLLRESLAGNLPVSASFDAQKTAMYNALLNLFGAEHANYIINLRFYYNPITSKLEPISFDGGGGKKLSRYVHFQMINNNPYADSVYNRELLKAIEKVSDPAYINRLLLENAEELKKYEEALKTEFNFNLYAKKNWRYNQSHVLKQQADTLRELLKTKTRK